MHAWAVSMRCAATFPSAPSSAQRWRKKPSSSASRALFDAASRHQLHRPGAWPRGSPTGTRRTGLLVRAAGEGDDPFKVRGYVRPSLLKTPSALKTPARGWRPTSVPLLSICRTLLDDDAARREASRADHRLEEQRSGGCSVAPRGVMKLGHETRRMKAPRATLTPSAARWSRGLAFHRAPEIS